MAGQETHNALRAGSLALNGVAAREPSQGTGDECSFTLDAAGRLVPDPPAGKHRAKIAGIGWACHYNGRAHRINSAEA
jgi:hypothetical protein